MKKYKDIGVYDFSDYAEEITGDALIEINGGAQIENSIEAQANAQVGDTVTNSKGETHVLTKGDITWAQDVMESRENSIKKEIANQGSGGNTNSGNNTSRNTENTQNDSASSSTDISSPNLKEQNNWTFNPNEPDSDKRYNAKDVKYKNKILHVMTISCDDVENFDIFAGYYITLGQYGAAGTTVYDGIALTDKNGIIIHVLNDEESVKKYAEYLNPSYAHNIYSPMKHSKNPKYNPNLNSDYIENNQLKSEREVYLESETSRYGFTGEIGFAKASSKTLEEGPASAIEVNLVTANAAWMNSPDYKKMGFGANLFSVDGEIGFQVGNKRFTVGAGLGFGFNLGFTKMQNKLYVDLGPLKGIHFTFENN